MHLAILSFGDTPTTKCLLTVLYDNVYHDHVASTISETRFGGSHLRKKFLSSIFISGDTSSALSLFVIFEDGHLLQLHSSRGWGISFLLLSLLCVLGKFVDLYLWLQNTEYSGAGNMGVVVRRHNLSSITIISARTIVKISFISLCGEGLLGEGCRDFYLGSLCFPLFV